MSFDSSTASHSHVALAPTQRPSNAQAAMHNSMHIYKEPIGQQPQSGLTTNRPLLAVPETSSPGSLAVRYPLPGHHGVALPVLQGVCHLDTTDAFPGQVACKELAAGTCRSPSPINMPPPPLSHTQRHVHMAARC
jgi:hypothetical protein